MDMFLIMGCVGALVGSITRFVSAQDTLQEIEGLLMLLMSAMCFCTLAILDKLDKALPPPRPPQ